jgi:hypothetical protein
MIEQWFQKEVRQLLDDRHRLVITDTKGEGVFLLPLLPKRVTLLMANNKKEELQARLDAERNDRDRNIVFYTTIAKRKLTQLQEYATTCGCIVLDDMEAYLKGLLHREMGINSMVDGQRLILAAKMDKGKDENWWRGVAQGIINPMRADEMILEFLKDPETYKRESDEGVFQLMQEEACRLVGKPNTPQDPAVFAKEFVNTLFSKLLNNTISDDLLNLYYSMVDSTEMDETVREYVDAYDIPASADPFCCHADHPFAAIDAMMFHRLSKMLQGGQPCIAAEKYIDRRISSPKAKRFKAPWLKDVMTLLQCDIGSPHLITGLEDFATYYKDTFAPIDTAMRRIYVAWLSETDVLRPVQEYYEQYNRTMLNAWYQFASHYTQTQQGLIFQCFNNSQGRTAIIVCDGLRLEMAEAIVKRKFPSGISITRNTSWSKLPSVTPNGMSALYGLDSVKEDSTSKRQQALLQVVPEVEFLPLLQLNQHVTAEKLVLLYGNIDKIGEKMQLSGLAEISGYEQQLYEKILELLKMGYLNIWLTTDHGYVITGILDEADKQPVPPGGTAEERFVTAVDPISDTSLLERNDDWLTGAYQYYAQTDKPFRTRGEYGYSHGGMTPQECLIPRYHIFQKGNQVGMKVAITNKANLKSVTGQFFNVALKGIGNGNDVFESERKVLLLFYNKDGHEISRSNIIKIKAGGETVQEYSLNQERMKLVVVDAVTTEQLDACDIEKSSSRDMGGLF